MEFSPESFRRALDVALGLVGAPPLAPDPQREGLWHLAPLDGSPATLDAHEELARGGRIDASWAETLDGLRVPYGLEPGHDDKPYPRADRWTWRRRSRLRPVRFRAAVVADDTSVHLHLEHRVAQRLLGQLSAQGFTRDGLARATVLTTGRGGDRVVLLGRVCVFGANGHRLHDEVVLRAAEWTGPPAERNAKLVVMKPDSPEEVATRGDLQHALARPTDEGLTEHRRGRFLAAVAADVGDLVAPLRVTAGHRSEVVRTQLERLGRRQAEALEKLLVRQQRFLQKKLEDPKQLRFEDRKGFSEADRAAWRSTVRAWEQRLDVLAREITEAPVAVREEYAVRHTHFELLGVVYLTRGA